MQDFYHQQYFDLDHLTWTSKQRSIRVAFRHFLYIPMRVDGDSSSCLPVLRRRPVSIDESMKSVHLQAAPESVRIPGWAFL